MAKFICSVPDYRLLGVRPARYVIVNDEYGGHKQVPDPNAPSVLNVEFERGVTSREDIAIGLAFFQGHATIQEDGSMRFPGLAGAPGLPMVQIYRGGQAVGATEPFRPENNFSWFDTDVHILKRGGTQQDVDDAVEALRSTPDNNTMFFEVIPRRIAPPFPIYDTQSLKNVLGVLKATGDNPHAYLAYEAANENRPEWIEAFEAAISSAVVEADDEVALEGTGAVA